jgi:hypothetical protein
MFYTSSIIKIITIFAFSLPTIKYKENKKSHIYATRAKHHISLINENAITPCNSLSILSHIKHRSIAINMN